MALQDSPARPAARSGDPALAARLDKAIEGEVLFDPLSRGRYSTDASIYQIAPLGVVIPRNEQDLATTLEIAAEEGLPVLPRGAGTSQCGQTVGEALVIDMTRHLDGLIALNTDAGTAEVQPGIVLDRLNAQLKPHGLWFPVDVSTASRATIGGMAGNNSCGSRSIRYGLMRDNVAAIDGLLADGSPMHFGELDDKLLADNRPSAERDLAARLLEIARREADEIDARFPKVMRRVGGYNLDALLPARPPGSGDSRAAGAPPNLAQLLVGSEGSLATFQRLHLKLSPLPRHRALGVCHFPSFFAAMDTTQHLVKLDPSAVELVDRTLIELAREIPLFREDVARFVKGEPAAILLVEFAGDDAEENLRRLVGLGEIMAERGFPDAVVEARDPAMQGRVWELRKQALNIVMSMKGEAKPVSFVEDCAVRLEDLADYTSRLEAIFEKHGTSGTWYAHASVGTLHVRPILNLKQERDVEAMRAVAEEAFAMVREYKGSHSGEHGDGLVRSEFHEAMFGTRITDAFREVKRAFDPDGRMNPGKIVDPPKMDDRSLFRFKPGYRTDDAGAALDWSAWGGFAGAIEMCNNNGACRKLAGGVMCPSFRATRNERDLTRGRANSLRLAISGQLGEGVPAAEALASDEMAETMKLCVSCKGCKRECPTGVDMARMKIEVLRHRAEAGKLSLRDRLIAWLPRAAPWLAKAPWLANLRDRSSLLRKLSESLLGLSARRDLPQWSETPFEPPAQSVGSAGGPEVVLLADTFNRYFEPDVLHAALEVLTAAGYRVHLPRPADGGSRPLCCGRTFLSAGLVEEARQELERTRAALAPFVARGLPILGLEPACLFTLQDELQALLPDADSRALGERAQLLESFLAAESAAGRLNLRLRPLSSDKALLHGHCHQKAFGALGATQDVLGLIPDLAVETLESSCCGMAGAFGYQAETHDISMKMAEQSLLPALRDAGPDTLVVADGTSCRHQIADGSDHRARHAVQLLAEALDRESGR